MRIRIRFSKLGKVRFTGHRDVARIWERALRKAEISVAYSEGFSPRPRIAFGLALPTGAESLAEFLDVELVRDLEISDVATRLSAVLPRGFSVAAVVPVDRSEPSLQEDVIACSWELTMIGDGAEGLVDAVEEALAAEELILERERKGVKKTDDLRPAIEHLEVRTDDDRSVVLATLATQPRGMRPSELLAVCFRNAADPADLVRRTLRTNQWIERDGARRDLVPLDAALAQHADVVCA